MFVPSRKAVAAACASAAMVISASSVIAEEVDPNSKANAQSFETAFNQLFSIRAESQRYIIRFKQTASDLHAVNQGLTTNSSDSTTAHSTLQQTSSLLESLGAKMHVMVASQNMIAATLSKQALTLLQSDKNVLSITPDVQRELLAQSTPFGYNMIQANQVVQSDPSLQTVCVIDSGISRGHPDLPNQNNGLTGEANNNQVGEWFTDGDGHGTHVAGTIAALDNSYGSVGVFPGVNLHVVKIFNDNGKWTWASNLISGITQCQQAGAKVVNMSLGGASPNGAERAAMDQFKADGMLLIAAAGNDGDSSFGYPASYDSVVSVAAVDWRGDRASYSQYNNQVELAAPGSAVLSTYGASGYVKLSGTSMATPHVSGAAALAWSFYPQCTNDEIRQALNATALDKGTTGRDVNYGHGIVQVKDAIQYLETNGCAADDGSQGGGGEEGGGEESVDPVHVELGALSAYTANTWKRFNFNLPAGAKNLQVETSGGWGEADLYVQRSGAPDLTNFDCESKSYRNSEICTFDAPDSGEWHIGVYARNKAFSGALLSYSYEFEEDESNLEPVHVEIGAVTSYTANTWKRFSVSVPADAQNFTVKTRGGWGEADLYLLRDGQPALANFDCSSRSYRNDETCVINTPEAGEWHIGVFARNRSFSGAVLSYSYDFKVP
ncbi:S8 family serine peptidase [Alteromonas oceanisediminis]|uniref:S8 family serine peptidase n=1 Tax=Alteromonas oceanisediminis TaxID=2836180 RepID=UPI001BD957D2|nr:S8 family serine peptidase [Alteromonas oceanisediminis]MBT0587758.1 S8 family peptidase [Alteromonas oceanisediminis]